MTRKELGEMLLENKEPFLYIISREIGLNYNGMKRCVMKILSIVDFME